MEWASYPYTYCAQFTYLEYNIFANPSISIDVDAFVIIAQQ